MPDLQATRQLAYAFLARAMLHTGNGLYTSAWNDLLITFRLARALQSSITVIEHLVGSAIERSGQQAIAAYLAAAPLQAHTWRRCLQDLQKIPARQSVSQTFELSLRAELLQFASQVHQGTLPEVIPYDLPEAEPQQIELLRSSLDWDETLRTLNRMWDEVGRALRQPDRPARKRALAELRRQCSQLGASETDFSWARVIERLRAGKVKEATQMVVAQVVLKELDVCERFHNLHDVTTQSERLLILAFTITIYREEQGQLPERLEQLVPKYLAQLEPDIFSGKPPIYRRTDTAFLIYSLGLNEKDDGGRDAKDSPPGERYDDLVVRVLAPRLLR